MSSFNHDSTGDEVVETFKSQTSGRTFVITGATRKTLGAGTALALAKGSPERIILLGRTASKVKPVIQEISQINPEVKATFVQLELDDLDSVSRAVSEIDKIAPKVDVLINNAGVMAVEKFTKNKAGIEYQFATNHIGHFYLTMLLLKNIKAAGKRARVVNLTSTGHYFSPVHFDDYNFADGNEYHRWGAYGQSKTANILFSRELAAQGIESYAVHPGVIWETDIANHLKEEDFEGTKEAQLRFTGTYIDTVHVPPKNLERGVSTTLVAALDPDLSPHSGAYMSDCAVEEPRAYAASDENAQRLWKLSEQLVGQKFKVKEIMV